MVEGITGRTRLYGIVADPVAQVKVPEALNALMAARGIDGVLVPFHVGAADLPAAVAGLRAMRNFGGMIVTVPHKEAVVGLCDAVEPRAALVGAVNCLRRDADGRIVGTILDGLGFVGGLRRAGIEPAGEAVYVAGAGGAAAAIAFALAEAGVSRLTIANRSVERADGLARRLAAAHPGLPVGTAGAIADHGLVVNATALGMRPDDPLPLDAGALRPGQTVAEIIMAPETTALMAAAEARGCRVHAGRPMLDAQLDLMADFMGMTA